MTRPDWNHYFMEMAELASKRSVCLRAKVGAVIVKDNQVLATGYNGPPRGVSHCVYEPGMSKDGVKCLMCEGTGRLYGGARGGGTCWYCKGSGYKVHPNQICVRMRDKIPSGEQIEKCRGLHAEQNAIAQAARHGVSVKEAKLYCNFKPCITCLKLCINAGIEEVIFLKKYEDPMVDYMAREAEIKLWRME